MHITIFLHKKFRKEETFLIMTDYHMHTNFSVDSNAPMEEMIEASIQKGLNEIVFTDHADYMSDGKPFPCQIQFDKYINVFRGMQKKYEGRITLRLGIELGLAPHLTEVMRELTAKYPFEFLIGSSHDIHGQELYLPKFFEGKTKSQTYNFYFEEVLTNCRLFDCFCVYGHLDYIRRYGGYRDNTLEYKDYAEIIDEILKTLIHKDKGLEINTSGYRYRLNQLHPQLPILKRFKELGGEIVTIGSDAHRPKDIADHFDMTEDYLRAAGFNAYTIFRNNKPYWVKL